jgi:hypothetical protein
VVTQQPDADHLRRSKSPQRQLQQLLQSPCLCLPQLRLRMPSSALLLPRLVLLVVVKTAMQAPRSASVLRAPQTAAVAAVTAVGQATATQAALLLLPAPRRLHSNAGLSASSAALAAAAASGLQPLLRLLLLGWTMPWTCLCQQLIQLQSSLHSRPCSTNTRGIHSRACSSLWMPCLLQGRSQGRLAQMDQAEGAGGVVGWRAGQLGRRFGLCWHRAVLALVPLLVLVVVGQQQQGQQELQQVCRLVQHRQRQQDQEHLGEGL